MTVRPFQHLPQPGVFSSLSDVANYTRTLWDALLKLRRGKIECVVTFTLAAGGSSTVLRDERLSPQSVVLFDPKTANAAIELASGGMYCLTANRANGQWTFTHANNAQINREFQVCIIG